MKEKRYMEDWKTETRFDEKGKETRVPVYQGVWYILDEKTDRKFLAWRAALSCGAFLLLIILYFRLDFPGATVLYVFLPAALGLFPALYWAMGAFSAARTPKEMTRLQKENGIGRVLRSSTGCAVCALAAVAGDAALILLTGKGPREWPGMLLLFTAACVAFSSMRYFRGVSGRLAERRQTNP